MPTGSDDLSVMPWAVTSKLVNLASPLSASGGFGGAADGDDAVDVGRGLDAVGLKERQGFRDVDVGESELGPGFEVAGELGLAVSGDLRADEV